MSFFRNDVCLSAVVGAVVHDLAVLDGLDNGVVLHGVAILVELQVTGDQTLDLQGSQCIADGGALGGAGLSMAFTAAM